MKSTTVVDYPYQTAQALPTIALSARWHTYPDRFDWIAAHGFALEYAPNPEAFDTLPGHLDPYLERGMPIRYHGFLPGYEIGHREPEAARAALDVHWQMLEAMHGRGDPVLTVHVGLRRDDPLDPDRAVQNLTALVERAQEMGIIVCLENLRTGPTSHPETVVGWAQAAGAMLTLDVGHMLSSRHVRSGAWAALDFVDLFADRLVEVHMYEQETDRHHPPQNMRLLGPVVDRLLTTRCTWWTIELDDYAEALATRALLVNYLEAKPNPA
jgi:sugar phosphate isomerase/epimerase